MQNTNPIEQRIELLADKWTEATYRQAGCIIRILAKPEEEEMVNSFFEYMLTLDSFVDEIATPNPATHYRLRNNGDGTFHGFPIDATAEPIAQGKEAKLKPNTH